MKRLCLGAVASGAVLAGCASAPVPAVVTAGEAATDAELSTFGVVANDRYFNVSGSPVPVRATPMPGAPVVGSVDPGQGGLVQACAFGDADRDTVFCRLSTGALNALGWVDMAPFSTDPGASVPDDIPTLRQPEVPLTTP